MTNGQDLLQLAMTMARVGHAEQSRLGTGEPYFNHVLRVARRVAPLGWRAMTVAYLHDLIEDTGVGGHTLLDVGFPFEIVGDVIALTRDYYEPNEPYAEFIQRGIETGSDIALQVKLADMHDNLTDPWLADKKGKRAEYVRADAAVRAALLERGVEPLVFS